MAISITPENFETVVVKATKPVIIDVFATWCGPCQQMAPVFEELSQEWGDKYVFAKLNVDEARDLSIAYGVTTVPTFIFIQNNVVKGKESGYMDKESLQELIVSMFA
jgi:thioredoxin 1